MVIPWAAVCCFPSGQPAAIGARAAALASLGLLGVDALDTSLAGMFSLALAGDEGARRRLRRSIAAECLLALGVLAILSFWRFTPPPLHAEEVGVAFSNAAAGVEAIRLHGAVALVP